ncbi:MAG: DUF2490 domain-containing protein [Gemmatimonadota bacterium]
MLALCALALAAAPLHTPLQAQRRTVRGSDIWTNTSGDQRLGPRVVLTWTIDERRSSLGQVPRQLLLVGGIMRDIGGGRRFGAGYAYLHTSPNEDFGPRRASDEHRVWQQFTGAHRTFGATWNHRLRWEQRWIAPEPTAGASRDWAYASRVRHQLRVVRPLDGRAPAASRFYVMPNSELFVRTVGHRGVFFDQSRLGVSLGVGVASRLNLEAGYLRQSIIRADGLHERHDVLQLTGRVPLQSRPR